MSQSWSITPQKYDPLKAGSIDETDEDPHDRAIVRAMNAKYKPNKSISGNPKCTLFVGKLNPQTSEDTVRQRFSVYGPLVKCRLVRDIVTGFSKCYAFVEYEEERDAREAYYEAEKTRIDGNEIVLEFEVERVAKGWIPRRLGGGWGGNKKSGQLRFGGRDRPFRKPYIIGESCGNRAMENRVSRHFSSSSHSRESSSRRHYSSHDSRRSDSDRRNRHDR